MIRILLILLILSGCSSVQMPAVSINGHLFEVEVADENQEQEIGLMNRESLDENKGMIFVFEQENKWGFWMKNTLIPLDMIFINKDGIIVDILGTEPCLTEVCPSYIPKENALYVLEINKGISQEKNIKIGDKVDFKF